jgi:Rieske Fe-S protein
MCRDEEYYMTGLSSDDAHPAGEGCGAACAHRGVRTVDADRRAFIMAGAAAIASLALTACGLSSDVTSPTSVSATTVKLSDYPALTAVGGAVALSVSGTPVAIVRESATAFSAFSLICPHQGNTVQITNAKTFYCPGHGAQFSITGQWTGGQHTSNLRSYPALYDATAGTVTVGG